MDKSDNLKRLNVLVACEFSGTVREAFRKLGHNAWSCDLIDAEDGSTYHYKNDINEVLRKTKQEWDMLIAFPPCTYLCSSGARWFKYRQHEQNEAIKFVNHLMNYPFIEKIAIENPVGVLSTKIRKPDQIIQPWMFGHGETKATCLWLKNLPKLKATNIVEGREARIHNMPPSKTRSMDRSRTYPGIAEAMAMQWGGMVGYD
ncbi:MAG: DNA cytosine methyltransferase [Nitrososphaera sp.]